MSLEWRTRKCSCAVRLMEIMLLELEAAGARSAAALRSVLRTRVVTLGKTVSGNEVMGWPEQLALSSNRRMRTLGQYLKSAQYPGPRIKPRIVPIPTHLVTMDISLPKTAAVPELPSRASLPRSKTSFRSCTFLLKGIPLLLSLTASLIVRVKRASCLQPRTEAW